MTALYVFLFLVGGPIRIFVSGQLPYTYLNGHSQNKYVSFGDIMYGIDMKEALRWKRRNSTSW